MTFYNSLKVQYGQYMYMYVQFEYSTLISDSWLNETEMVEKVIREVKNIEIEWNSQSSWNEATITKKENSTNINWYTKLIKMDHTRISGSDSQPSRVYI